MGHALTECWRVLKPGGTLIDIRPCSENPSMEIVSETETRTVGLIDDSAGFPGDLAADAALETVVQGADFVEEEERYFTYVTFWDTLENTRTHYKDRTSEFVLLPDVQLEDEDRLIRESDGGIRVRVQRSIYITRYRKVGGG